MIQQTLRLVLLAVLLSGYCSATRADSQIQLKVVGGLANVSQYEHLEKPFWQSKIETISHGRISAEIHSFDKSGLPGQEMLQLMRLGVVNYGTVLLALVSADEPELNAVDLPGLSPDIQALRKTVQAYRPQLDAILKDKFNVKLLAIYTYPAQAVFCAKRFTRLQDLAGRRVRTSSVGQSEMMAGLGAVPVLLPFNEMVKAVRTGVVDCAITGTLSGNEIGLSKVTSYVSPMAISWGLSVFGANLAAWQSLPPDVRSTLRSALAGLEQDVWAAAARETVEGLACDTGGPGCAGHQPSHMNLVPITPADEAARKQLLVHTVLPKWIERCGPECSSAWNKALGPLLHLETPRR